jgi:hypothetical protein
MSDDHQIVLIRGIAAHALTAAMRVADTTQDLDEASALDELRRIDADAATLLQAAEVIRRFPMPPDEPAEKAARLESFQKMLGASTATEDLEAQLRAREWLQMLAEERTNR